MEMQLDDIIGTDEDTRQITPKKRGGKREPKADHVPVDESTWIDLTELQKGSPAQTRVAIERAIHSCLNEHGKLPLHHLLWYRQVGGQRFLEAIEEGFANRTLDEAALGQYRFRCVRLPVWRSRHKDPQPGDIYFAKRAIRTKLHDPRTGELTSVTTGHTNLAVRRGRERGDSFDVTVWIDRKLDKDLTFVVGYRDAMQLLTTVTEINPHLDPEKIELEYVS